MYNTGVQIILTHEQADFDALASLLGAYLLDEQSIPVLPRRLNRNVRAFLTLYGLEFPFLEARDLPKTDIHRVTLVDTQSMVTLKGMGKETEVFIIDHHTPRPDLPEHWKLTSEDIGATVTILVEALQERGTRLSVAQATLLLLGIYEDTGKLTYARTTPRDIRAAAYLLDSGASLQIMQDFLNHPLSQRQQEIYDRLRQKMETLDIHGNTVMIGQADARGGDEELSTIAHKLRDLLDPDVLILVIDIPSGTQLVARATTDQVDLGALTAHFGGGGHPRAAAALVRDRRAKDVYKDLVAVLPEMVRPVVTVAELMSRRPQLLSPETSVKEVSKLMQRYGYEGYPVVEEGKLLGLLNRRAVDRALSHKLNLKAKDVMDAGQATISPDASLEALQLLMTDTGWGQIPVVEDGEIVGIVTRTDLIKTLTPSRALGGSQNLAGKLENSLPPARLALLQAVAEIAQEEGMALYIVGGFVRDLMLERPSVDFDLVVEGDAIVLGKSLAERYGGRVTTHRRFGTAKWQLSKIRTRLAQSLQTEDEIRLEVEDFPEALDLVTARREFYTHPTALPTVERGSIKLDLHRRDFTINTLALRLDGRHYGDLYDYWGGLADLGAGLVRVLHSLSFVDDPTRILRAVRFEQRFGYRIEERTLELLEQAVSLMDRVSGDRLRHELNIILGEPHWEEMLARLAELGVFAEIGAEIPWDETAADRIRLGMETDPPPEWKLHILRDGYPLKTALAYVLWWLVLPAERARATAKRLRLPGWLRDALLAAIGLWDEQDKLSGAAPSEVVGRFEGVPGLALLAYWLALEDSAAQEQVDRYFQKWQHVQPVTSGHDLREMDLPPGPGYGQILERLRAAWLDGELSTPEEEQVMLAQLVKDYGRAG
jgi:tRNA nucleotidyltransferase (CCA-adding enzyme)